MSTEQFASIRVAAKVLGLPEHYLRSMARENLIPLVRVNAKTLINLEATKLLFETQRAPLVADVEARHETSSS